MFSDVWSENAVLLKKLMKIDTKPPILYYGFMGGITRLHALQISIKFFKAIV